MSQQQTSDSTHTEGTILRVENVIKQYDGLVAVDGVSFDVEEGEILSIIGPNGAGKTTLFNVINGFLKPTDGRVVLQGTDLTDKPPHVHTKHGMARTFQIVKPFEEMTMKENVMVGSFYNHRSASEAEQHTEQILDELDLHDLADEPAGTLSVKDKKRMELARALATEPDLLLVDELMAGLNDRELQEILTLLREINERGQTIMIIEHIMEAVMSISDRILVLSNGRLIAEGTPEEVSENEQVIKVYLGERWQQEGETDA